MNARAVIFDLDGVLIESERVWDAVRERLANEAGGRWHDGAQREMMGMSSPEWSRYMSDQLGVPLAPAEISDEVVRRVMESYRERLPLLPGATDAVRRIADRWPLGLASSSNRPIIDLVLERAGVAELFEVTVSSEEVSAGKPAPDVYLEAAARMDVEAADAAAIEDSSNGLRSARAAGLGVVAIPNRQFPPAADAVAEADVVLGSLEQLSPATIEAISPR